MGAPRYNEEARLLEMIEELRKAPSQIEKLVAAGGHVEAAKLTMLSVARLASEKLRPVPALRELRPALEAQAETLGASLVAALQTRIYNNSKGEATVVEALRRRSNAPPQQGTDDGAITSTIEALHVLQLVPVAVKVLAGGIREGVVQTLDRTMAQCERELRPQFSAARTPGAGSGSSTGLATAADQSGPRLLVEALTTLYAEMIRVYRAHRTVLETVRQLRAGGHVLAESERAGLPYTEARVWEGIRLELAQLLCQYLDVNEEQAVNFFSGGGRTSGEGAAAAAAAASAQGGEKAVARGLFRFANSLNALAETSGKIEAALQDTTADERRGPGRGSIQADQYSAAVLPRHRLLCEPSILNIAGAFKPTMALGAALADEAGFTGSTAIFTRESTGVRPARPGARSQSRPGRGGGAAGPHGTRGIFDRLCQPQVPWNAAQRSGWADARDSDSRDALGGAWSAARRRHRGGGGTASPAA